MPSPVLLLALNTLVGVIAIMSLLASISQRHRIDQLEEQIRRLDARQRLAQRRPWIP